MSSSHANADLAALKVLYQGRVDDEIILMIWDNCKKNLSQTKEQLEQLCEIPGTRPRMGSVADVQKFLQESRRPTTTISSSSSPQLQTSQRTNHSNGTIPMHPSLISNQSQKPIDSLSSNYSQNQNITTNVQQTSLSNNNTMTNQMSQMTISNAQKPLNQNDFPQPQNLSTSTPPIKKPTSLTTGFRSGSSVNLQEKFANTAQQSFLTTSLPAKPTTSVYSQMPAISAIFPPNSNQPAGQSQSQHVQIQKSRSFEEPKPIPLTTTSSRDQIIVGRPRTTRNTPVIPPKPSTYVVDPEKLRRSHAFNRGELASLFADESFTSSFQTPATDPSYSANALSPSWLPSSASSMNLNFHSNNNSVGSGSNQSTSIGSNSNLSTTNGNNAVSVGSKSNTNSVKSVDQVKGIRNNSENNCFLNSLLQVLFHQKEFRQWLDNNETSHSKVHKEASTSCIWCALRVVFIDYEYGDQNIVSPSMLREALALLYSKQNKFQLEVIDDAAECYEAVLEQLHVLIDNSKRKSLAMSFMKKPLLSYCVPWCGIHEKFAINLSLMNNCKCGEFSSSAVQSYILYVSAASLKQEYLSLSQVQQKTLNLASIINKATALTSVCQKCKKEVKSSTVLENDPETIVVGLVHDSSVQDNVANKQDIQLYLNLMSNPLHLSGLFDSRSASTNETYKLSAIVSYYGKHFNSFSRMHLKDQQDQWCSFDDSVFHVLGADFAQVISKCESGRLLPFLLWFSKEKPQQPQQQ